MQFKKRNIIISFIILVCSISVIGCAEVKEITVKKNVNVSTATGVTAESSNLYIDTLPKNTIATPAINPSISTSVVDGFVNTKFKTDTLNIYIQCKKGWETKYYNMDITGGKSVIFAKKYVALEGLNDYEKKVYKDIAELDQITYNYFRWIPKNLNADKTPNIKVRIELLLNKYKDVLQ